MTTLTARKRVTLKHVAGAALCSFLVIMAIPPARGTAGSFPEGVASRATPRSAILWTRAENPGDYSFKISKRKNLTNAVDQGPVEADAGDDFTIKKTVKGLDPSTRYYFRFFSDDDESSLGTFRTMPGQGKRREIELAVSGDSDELWDPSFDPDDDQNPQSRPFAVLDRIREDRPDLFVYMGDTIYSDSETGAPLAETLEEKWEKYRNNRLPATKGVLKKVSTWAVWDDHEVVNDFDGAVLKDEDPDLFAAGLDAFRDYWPIPDSGKMYRKVDYGSEIDLIFLDERRYRDESADIAPTPCRENDEDDLDLAPTMPEEDRADLPGGGLPPADPDCIALLNDPERSLLGQDQLDWFKKQLRTSDARWKLVINEVPISELFVRPYDRWEGYQGERNKILNFIDNRNIRGVVFLTTDLHANIGARVYKDITDEGSNHVAYELIAGPIQTCTLDCEVDQILGSNIAGEILKDFLIDQDLADADCINIDHNAYGLVSTFDSTTRLKLEWKSHMEHPTQPGGANIGGGCVDKTLKPSVSGG